MNTEPIIHPVTCLRCGDSGIVQRHPFIEPCDCPAGAERAKPEPTPEQTIADLRAQLARMQAERDKIKKWYEQSEDDCAIADDHLAELQDAMGCKTDLEGSQKKAMERLRDLIAAEGELGDVKAERDDWSNRFNEAKSWNGLVELELRNLRMLHEGLEEDQGAVHADDDGRPSQGKKKYTVSLTEKNVTKAQAREANFSGLLDSLLSRWLEND